MSTTDVKTNFPMGGGKPTLSSEPELTQTMDKTLSMGSKLGTNPYAVRRKTSTEQPQTFAVPKSWDK